MAVTVLADLIIPEIFNPYTQQLTEQKSRLVQSGALARSSTLDADLAGGGLTFKAPSFEDLADDDDNVSDDDASASTPVNIEAGVEIAVRLSRNQTWGSADLNADLIGADPMNAIASRVSSYWVRRQQRAFVATVQGVFADNAAAPSGSEHVQNDLTVNISDDAGGAYSAGVTDFSAEAMIDAATTMGDSAGDLTVIMVHSVVYARMQKNNLIDFIPDSEGRVVIPTFLGRIVIVDDGLPNPAGAGAAATGAGIYHTWLFGAGAFLLGVGSPKVPTETDRDPLANNGGGEETLTNRVMWAIHPRGHAYVGTPTTEGGPSNATSANNLAHADSWQRRFPERKQIKIARLITKES